jgi:hypothetical protein
MIGICSMSAFFIFFVCLIIGFIIKYTVGILFILSTLPGIFLLTLILIFKRKNLSSELLIETFWSGIFSTIIVGILEIFTSYLFLIFLSLNF